MPQKFLAIFYIKIDGQDVPQEFVDSILEVVVDTSLYIPDMFTILLRDPKLKWADDTLLDLGKAVEISVKQAENQGGEQGVLIKGEITALEPTFSGKNETTTLVRGYTKGHRLHRGKQTRSFLNIKDSDIASKLAGEAGLSAQVDTTSITYDYVLQYNQTNMEFLQARAGRIGYQVLMADGKLYFKKGDANLGSGPTLELGMDLMEFQPHLASTHQANEVIVRGWDGKQKQAIEAKATPNTAMNQGGQTKTGGVAARSAFSDAKFVLVDRPIFTQSEAEALATGLMNDLCGEFVQAEGVCYGDPGIKPGYKITIKGVGTRFSGQYFVTSATHIYNAEAGYETHFAISGRQPNTVNHLLEPRHSSDTSRGFVQGVVIGLVTNVNDPDNLGRVKVKYPWLGRNQSGTEIESWWLKVAAPGAGATRGMYYLPEVNDEVLIAFEHGDIHRPYLIGGLWNSKDAPPEQNGTATSAGKVNHRIIQSRLGHVVVLDDTEGEGKVQVKTKAGHLVILDDTSGAEKITIKDKTGNNTFIIDSAKNDISMTCVNNITLKCNQKLSIDCTNLEISAKGTGKVKTTGPLDLEATGPLNAKGAIVSVNGSTMTEIKGGPMVVIQGGLVKIN